jgi:hypothetical protein
LPRLVACFAVSATRLIVADLGPKGLDVTVKATRMGLLDFTRATMIHRPLSAEELCVLSVADSITDAPVQPHTLPNFVGSDCSQ